MRRREFLGVMGGAAISPLAASAQQHKIPIVGFVGVGSPTDYSEYVSAFRRTLSELGFNEGRNVAIEFRWARGQYDRLPSLLDDLIKSNISVIIAGGPPVARAAKAATSTVPIVFVSSDAVRLGLVDSLNHPGANLTGVSIFTTAAIIGKRLQILRQCLPAASRVLVLLSPQDLDEPAIQEVSSLSHSIGLEIFNTTAASDREIENAFSRAVDDKLMRSS